MSKRWWTAVVVALVLAVGGLAVTATPRSPSRAEVLRVPGATLAAAFHAPLPTRVSVAVVTGTTNVLGSKALGLPPLRLTAVRIPAGFRIRHRRSGDAIIGRARSGRQVLVLEARRRDAGSGVRHRIKVVVTGRPPRARAGTVLVSRGLDGEPADADAWAPLLSGDGNTVLFSSAASHLVRKHLVGDWHLFAWDRRRRRIELVGLLPDGSPAALATATDVSADGRVLLFATDAQHQWMRDRGAGTTVAVPPSAELTAAGALVTYADLPVGWAATGAASQDGRYLALRGPILAPPNEQDAGSYAVAVWDSVARALVHRTTIFYGLESAAGVATLTDDGRLAYVGRWASGEVGGDVVDMATGELVVLDALSISGDARHVLVRVGWWGLVMDDLSDDSAVTLVRRPLTDAWSPGAGIRDATLAPDGSAVAFSDDGEDLLPGLRPRHSQVYLWRDMTAEGHR